MQISDDFRIEHLGPGDLVKVDCTTCHPRFLQLRLNQARAFATAPEPTSAVAADAVMRGPGGAPPS